MDFEFRMPTRETTDSEVLADFLSLFLNKTYIKFEFNFVSISVIIKAPRKGNSYVGNHSL